MRLLLDECIPRKLKNHLTGYRCQTEPEAGFAGKTNGELLNLAENEGFDVSITLDKGISYQQNLAPRHLAVILIRSQYSRLENLLAHLPQLISALDVAKKGELTTIGE